jgi:hypothetical protein
MDQLLIKQFEVTRGSNTILRNHTTVTNAQPSSYSVGMHIGGCVQMLLLCYPKASQTLTRRIVFHDYEEYLTGDVVGSAKVKFPALGLVLKEVEAAIDREYKINEGHDLSNLEHIVLELVDRAELLVWCYEQYEMGCRTPRFLAMMTRVAEKVHQLKQKFEQNMPGHPSEYEKHLSDGTANLYAYIQFRGKEAARKN